MATITLSPELTPRLSSVRSLVQRFESTTLPRKEWTHEAHLKVGVSYLLDYGFAGALRRIRKYIQRYNRRTGRNAREVHAYHETITVFCLWLLWEFLRRNQHVRNRHVLFGRLLEDGVARQELLERYYSAARLHSATARRRFVMPDLVRLPYSVWKAISRVTDVAPLIAPAHREKSRRIKTA